MVLFALGSLVEAFFYGQINAFTSLYLPELGIATSQVARWTGPIASMAGVLGLPLFTLYAGWSW